LWRGADLAKYEFGAVRRCSKKLNVGARTGEDGVKVQVVYGERVNARHGHAGGVGTRTDQAKSGKGKFGQKK